MNRLEQYVAQHNPEMDGDVVAEMRKRRRIKRVEAEKREREFFNAPWRRFLVVPYERSRGARFKSSFDLLVKMAMFESKNFIHEMSGYYRWEAWRAFVKALREQPSILEGAFREALFPLLIHSPYTEDTKIEAMVAMQAVLDSTVNAPLLEVVVHLETRHDSHHGKQTVREAED